MSWMHLALAALGGSLAVAGTWLKSEALFGLGATLCGGVVGHVVPIGRKNEIEG